ncbi:hypothetical protein ANCCAN_15758 [Ancylostoma caninum]|uniref:Uncharacterized protein n=1 Tax=Ancylostoma caninum TaxID=29170 RepID=A0A368FR30_ANCCA|nr:hypothetical protein ANCCAN_20217 [Ancylostoma caninum]RCN38316.1 hypothetical protein ANCCAN_15758 [Ancylostoma caninum]
MMKVLRRMFDSNPERRSQRELPFPFRDLRSRRMLLNFSKAY